MFAERFKCEEEGCTITDTVGYDDPSGDETINLCDEHAKKQGFCLGCMQYCAGFESYMFSSVPGWCAECVSQLRHESDDYDEYEDWDDYDDFEYEGY